MMKNRSRERAPMMNPSTMLSALHWAEDTFGSVHLGDQRRTVRAVEIASAIAHNPAASLPAQMQDDAATEAAYRFLQMPDVSYEKLIGPHVAQTRAQASKQPQVLLIQETTEVDYQQHPTTTGLGPIGNGSHHGYLVQSVLAVRPSTREVLGLAHQEPFLRQPTPKGETAWQRKQRERESQVWERSVQAIGSPPPGVQWIHVGDRAGDMFPLLSLCRQLQCDFVVRGWPARGEQELDLEATKQVKARTAYVLISWGCLRRLSPRSPQQAQQHPLVVWVVHVWEPAPPVVVETVEWILLTSVPVATLQQAWQRVEWYRARWIVEIVQTQMTKTNVLTALGGGDHIADLHLFISHHHTINQQLDQLPFLLKGDLSESELYPVAKSFDGLDHACQFIMAPHTRFQLAHLFG